MLDDDVRLLLSAYPRIFFACHVRHVRDPKTRRELSSHQASILDHLDSKEPASLNGLAKHMGVTASTMSLNVDRLERGGYVVRRRDPRDARRVSLLLTPAGSRIKRLDKVLDEGRVRSLLARLPERDRAEALRGLEALARAAQLEIESRIGRGRNT